MAYKLKARRVEKGIKQSTFAKEMGITPQYLCKIEKGEADPRRDLMMRISKALEASPQELFFNEEN
ncbi:helix-turn-helix transcriptional regulator [Clostridium sp.]|uniref:helix-turn-helix transcriptional regulator n=1 Tax=Clostridium sp. TaxID=1506 RepID=UPI0035A14455